MKPIKIITTFSKNGYSVYGQNWINTYNKNVNDKNVSVDLYLDFDLNVNGNIQIINYDAVIPHHKKWLQDFSDQYDAGLTYNKKMAMRFSYKAFVMQHALKHNNNCYLIWLDGDCIFKEYQDFTSFPQNILNNKFIAVQREHNHDNDHCESGIVVFDTDHPDKEKFLNAFIENYKIENTIHMNQPYDGFLIYKSINGIEYSDLNEGYGKGGIQSDPSLTFLHPELQKRFLHNIGITGKKQYESFDRISKDDEYFRLLEMRDKRTPEEIEETKNKLLELRRRS